MTEGLFWIICHMKGDVIDWTEEWEIYHLFAKSNSISHKDAWVQFAKKEEKHFCKHEYNYYPRGRVVVRNDRATIFLNQYIATDEVLLAISKVFGLTKPKVHAEGNKHYECYINRANY